MGLPHMADEQPAKILHRAVPGLRAYLARDVTGRLPGGGAICLSTAALFLPVSVIKRHKLSRGHEGMALRKGVRGGGLGQQIDSPARSRKARRRAKPETMLGDERVECHIGASDSCVEYLSDVIRHRAAHPSQNSLQDRYWQVPAP